MILLLFLAYLLMITSDYLKPHYFHIQIFDKYHQCTDIILANE